MSIWTHITGTIRIDDFDTMSNLSNIFIRDTWHNRNKNGNLPSGSEGSIDVEIIERNEEGTEYMKTVAFFGDLRDFDSHKCQEVKKWWFEIPNRLKSGYVRQAVLQVQCEDGYECILTEKDMNLKTED